MSEKERFHKCFAINAKQIILLLPKVYSSNLRGKIFIASLFIYIVIALISYNV
jgi:hypothetical protein